LTLPNSLKKFDCSENQITSLDGLILPNSLIGFYCFENDITVIRDFIFPSSLVEMIVDNDVSFINPKFNSILEYYLTNKVEFDLKYYSHDELIFLYCNMEMNFQRYDEILNHVISLRQSK
jgi:Leucine-rich repeat (LRR) protein